LGDEKWPRGLYVGLVELGTVIYRDTLKARRPMAGTTAATPLDDGRIDTIPTRPTDVRPTAADVEAELQRIARQRLAYTTQPDARSRPHRSTRSTEKPREPIVGAFDSPEGFAFDSDGENRRR
jgi:hypothetical protein